VATNVTAALDWFIEQPEYAEREQRVKAELENRGLDALVLFHPIRMAYVSGFFHLSTERPMALVVPLGEGMGAMVPHLEQEHIAQFPTIKNVRIYPEYPTGGTMHPMLHLAELLKEMGLSGKTIGYDSNGYDDINGYDGPTLDEVFDGKTVKARDLVDKMRAVKSENEIRLIAESCKWGNLAHWLMHRRLELGRSSQDISMEASTEASKMMTLALGPTYQQLTTTWGMPCSAGYNAGSNTSMPHPLHGGQGLKVGDVLVTGAAADVGGYHSELERTMIIGEPNADFIKYFEIMVQLQQAGFDALKPGRTLAEAEEEVSRAFADLGVAENQRHHTGHSIGLEGHESPFIDKGDETVIAEGLVFTIEPGVYVPGVAGFRHSDTIVVRANGSERLTYYPRDLASMIVRL
jgi:Xaa-Pro aminopeptidase